MNFTPWPRYEPGEQSDFHLRLTFPGQRLPTWIELDCDCAADAIELAFAAECSVAFELWSGDVFLGLFEPARTDFRATTIN